MRSEIVKVKAFNIDDNGKGIVRYNNQTIFVDNLLKDEEGQVKLIYAYDKLKEAKLIKRETTSKYRVKPKCAYYEL